MSHKESMEHILTKSREIFKMLLEDQRTRHSELCNEVKKESIKFKLNNMVFAKRQIQSSTAKDRVGKLFYMAGGPWKIIEMQDNDSYTLHHLQHKNRTTKKRSYDLYPCPKNLHPLIPITGPYLAYGAINKPITEHPYKHAGIKHHNKKLTILNI